MKTLFQGHPEYRHGSPSQLGVLLLNLGTPDAATAPALRRYLAEFLWDPRVVEAPRWLWWLILNGIVLNTRPPRSAAAYREVWDHYGEGTGSPLLHLGGQQRTGIAERLSRRFAGPVSVALGMRYGNPSTRAALRQLDEAGVRRLIVLPLYPQYSASTSASCLDAVFDELKTWRWLPELRVINHYHRHPGYIESLAASVREHWGRHGMPERLIMSFHGVPKRYLLNGDPYHCECHVTARLVAERLGLPEGRWMVTFQSRFGREEWLKPYTDETLKALPGQGVRRVDVLCPGFSADCLETIEEIDGENREYFLHAGGSEYHYIPALNDREDHLDALADLITQHAQGWPELNDWQASRDERERKATAERARKLGAAQ